MPYFNTNRQNGTALVESQATARTQEERILAFFRKRAILADGRAERYTPEEIMVLVFPERVPLTSVRRAMSNLTEAGDLIKTDHMKEGLYGKPVHSWQLANPKPRQAEMFGGTRP